MSDARLTSLGEGKGPIVLQGAMEMEVAPFIKRLKGAELEVYGDFFFWRGTFGTRPLIISQTGIGTAAAGAATALACALYQPSLIVNQGTAGGYGDLAVGDVVLASALYNANARYLGRDGLRFMELGSLEHESVAAMDFPDVPPLLETDERLRYILEAFLKKSGASYPLPKKLLNVSEPVWKNAMASAVMIALRGIDMNETVPDPDPRQSN